jgi:uncharacterized protein (DUF362 family)
LGCLVFADDPIAADVTCCQLMSIDPMRVRHLAMAAELGNADNGAIEQRGETVAATGQKFELMPEFTRLRATSTSP